MLVLQLSARFKHGYLTSVDVPGENWDVIIDDMRTLTSTTFHVT